MSLVTSAKKLWRRTMSHKLTNNHVPFDETATSPSKQAAEFTSMDPVTLAVIGCGQRGKVSATSSGQRETDLLGLGIQ